MHPGQKLSPAEGHVSSARALGHPLITVAAELSQEQHDAAQPVEQKWSPQQVRGAPKLSDLVHSSVHVRLPRLERLWVRGSSFILGLHKLQPSSKGSLNSFSLVGVSGGGQCGGQQWQTAADTLDGTEGGGAGSQARAGWSLALSGLQGSGSAFGSWLKGGEHLREEDPEITSGLIEVKALPFP